MLTALIILAVLAIVVFIFIQQPSFGKNPSNKERVERIKNSSNYRDGKFQNLKPTLQFSEDSGYLKIIRERLFKKYERKEPVEKIPAIKTNLHDLPSDKDILVWFGHSSYFIQLNGKRILVDPVFNSASPLSFLIKPFDSENNYTADDIPAIDYLFISHDHWDHLDYKTILSLKDKIGKVVCSLGVGEHFEYWGFKPDQIIELDWNENTTLDTGFTVYCLPAQHFSGRSLSPNQTLWASYLLEASDFKIYIGGDSGYNSHFTEIGDKFEKIDLAILENGQYDTNWKYIHMFPEQTLQAAKDLNSTTFFPIHSSKFALANHSWDEPLIRVSEATKDEDIRLITPMIGEIVNIKDTTQTFSQWWNNIQ